MILLILPVTPAIYRTTGVIPKISTLFFLVRAKHAANN